MKSNNDRIRDRVRQLLAIAHDESSTVAETEAAMGRAARLMAEHHIDRGHLDEDECGERVLWRGRRRSTELRFATAVLDEFFFVRCFYRVLSDHSTLVIAFGEPCDLDVAEYVATYLTRTFRALWAAYRSKHAVSDKTSYILGLWIGVSRRMTRDRNESAMPPGDRNSLIRSGRNLEYAFSRRYGQMSKRDERRPKDVNLDSLSDGIRRGATIAIRKAVAADSTANSRRLT